MITKVVLTKVAVGMLAALGIGAASSAASAHEHYGYGGYATSCQPIYRQVQWYDNWGQLHVSDQFAGQRCTPVATWPGYQGYPAGGWQGHDGWRGRGGYWRDRQDYSWRRDSYRGDGVSVTFGFGW